MSHPADNAREGVRLLEAAVVAVLAHGECLGPATISKRAGIHRGIGSSRHDGITEGIINKLHEAGVVEPCTQHSGRGGWRLSRSG